jgi:hypothetical protein
MACFLETAKPGVYRLRFDIDAIESFSGETIRIDADSFVQKEFALDSMGKVRMDTCKVLRTTYYLRNEE